MRTLLATLLLSVTTVVAADRTDIHASAEAYTEGADKRLKRNRG